MSTPPPAAAPAGPDRPTIPAVRRSWLMKGYLALSVLVLTGFTLAGVFGWELQGGTRDQAPGSARQTATGLYQPAQQRDETQIFIELESVSGEQRADCI